MLWKASALETLVAARMPFTEVLRESRLSRKFRIPRCTLPGKHGFERITNNRPAVALYVRNGVVAHLLDADAYGDGLVEVRWVKVKLSSGAYLMLGVV